MDEKSEVLAWQADIARRIAGQCEFVLALTDKLGGFSGAENMKVELFPRRPFGVPRRAGGFWLMNAPVWKLCRRHRIDVCFVHMAHEWANYLAPCFRALNMPVLLWYAHGSVTRSLHRALRNADRVVTSTPEGFRISSDKVRVIGQGIDTDLFSLQDRSADRSEMIYVGRVSRRKRVELLLDVMSRIREKNPESPVKLRVVGPAITADDKEYEAGLRAAVRQRGLDGAAELAGFVPRKDTPAFYRGAFLHINVSDTGSMDKTVNEALACGCPALTSNPAFRELFAGHPEFIITDERPEAIARQVLELYDRRDSYDPTELRNLIVGRHDMNSYVEKIVANLEDIMRKHE